MKFKLQLGKTSDASATVAVEFLNANQYMLFYKYFTIDANQIELEFDHELTLDDSYVLKVTRHDHSLYSSDQLVHDSYVIVENIIIDDFWVIGKNNHWSTTVFDTKYIEHLKDKLVTWELSNTVCNNTLYFNGSLEYNITAPIRKMFFK